MATITLSLTGNIDGTSKTVSKTATIEDGVLPYFFQCYQQKFSVESPITTNEAAFDALAADFAGSATREVLNFVKQQALQQIVLPNIQVTPQ